MNQVDEKPLPGCATGTPKILFIYLFIYIGTASQTLLTNDTNYVCDAGYILTNA